MAVNLLGTHSQLPATRSRRFPAQEDAPGPLLDTTSIPLFDSSISEPIYSSGHTAASRGDGFHNCITHCVDKNNFLLFP